MPTHNHKAAETRNHSISLSATMFSSPTPLDATLPSSNDSAGSIPAYATKVRALGNLELIARPLRTDHAPLPKHNLVPSRHVLTSLPDHFP